MLVRDVMTRSVECIPPDATIVEAARKMRDLDVGLLPVGDEVDVVGTISDRDIAVRSVAEGDDPRMAFVEQIMSPEVISCFEADAVEQAAKTMSQRLVRRLIVLGEDRRLAGIISLADLVTQQGNDELVIDALENISEPVHSTSFHHSPGVERQTADAKGVSG